MLLQISHKFFAVRMLREKLQSVQTVHVTKLEFATFIVQVRYVVTGFKQETASSTALHEIALCLI